MNSWCQRREVIARNQTCEAAERRQQRFTAGASRVKTDKKPFQEPRLALDPVFFTLQGGACLPDLGSVRGAAVGRVGSVEPFTRHKHGLECSPCLSGGGTILAKKLNKTQIFLAKLVGVAPFKRWIYASVLPSLFEELRLIRLL